MIVLSRSRDEATSTSTVADKDMNSKHQQQRGISLNYGIDDNSPWYLCILLAFQVTFRRHHHNYRSLSLKLTSLSNVSTEYMHYAGRIRWNFFINLIILLDDLG